jgi:hypothetical protein
MKIEVQSDNKQLLRHLREVSDQVTPAAEASALNSTAKKVAREAVKLASVATGVPTKVLRRRIYVPKRKKATRRRLHAYVLGGLWVVPVSQLTPKPRQLKGGSVKYRVPPGQAINPQAFMAKTTRGGTEVFVRKTASRLPIKKVSVDIADQVKRAINGYLHTAAAHTYYQQRLFAEMDRKIRASMRRNGLDVS